MRKILNFIQNLFGCKQYVKPIEIKNIPENMLTPREEGKEIINLPQDEFLCPKCNSVPEIKEVHFYTNKLIIYCKNCGKLSYSATEYINRLFKADNYLNIVCSSCNKLPRRRETGEIKMKYCPICRRAICGHCSVKEDKEHESILKPINEKNKLNNK